MGDEFRYDLYVYDQANKLLQAARLIADTDPDWWEVWNGEPFSQELIVDLVTVARRVNHYGVVQARSRKDTAND